MAAVIQPTWSHPCAGVTRRARRPTTSATSPSKASSSHPCRKADRVAARPDRRQRLQEVRRVFRRSSSLGRSAAIAEVHRDDLARWWYPGRHRHDHIRSPCPLARLRRNAADDPRRGRRAACRGRRLHVENAAPRRRRPPRPVPARRVGDLDGRQRQTLVAGGRRRALDQHAPPVATRHAARAASRSCG